MWTTKSVKCPVCSAILGKEILNQYAEYRCKECQWIFPYSRQGKALPPIKMNPKPPQKCGCEGCKYRDEQAAQKNLDKN